MSETIFYENSKNDFKDLESYLVKNKLVDDRRIWFGGFDNYRKSTNNAIAGNLLYGNKRLIIVTLKDNDINFLQNTKSGFKLKVIGSTLDKNKVSSFRNIMYPVIDITPLDGTFYSVKVTKNKDKIKEFKKNI